MSIPVWKALLPVAAGESFWFPAAASNHAGLVDSVYAFIYWVSVVSFVLIVGAMVVFSIKYRASAKRPKPGKASSHNTWLEIGWSLPPAVVGAILFYVGAVGYIDMRTPPDDSYDIRVRARKWAWEFEYPGGLIQPDLHVPEGRAVRLIMSSDDILHSFFVPAFRVKRDVVPGRYNYVWFEATQEGTFQIYCTEYCGTRHSEMLSKVIVHSQAGYTNWLSETEASLNNETPEQAGMRLVAERGCRGCHSLDGSRLIGPSLKGLYNRKRPLNDGSVVVADDNYIRTSLLNPAKQVVEGYAPVMPTFQGRLTDRELDSIIAYIKSISQGEK